MEYWQGVAGRLQQNFARSAAELMANYEGMLAMERERFEREIAQLVQRISDLESQLPKDVETPEKNPAAE